MRIVDPITEDGLVGYDEFKQLVHVTPEINGHVSRFITDVRGMVCRICGRGWHPNAPSLGDQLHDECLGWCHESCFIRHRGICDQQAVYHALCGVVRFNRFRTFPNQYWAKTDPWSKIPWFRAELPDAENAELLIGSRKRVIHIELNASWAYGAGSERRLFSWAEKAEEAFKDEGVTKHFDAEQVYVHAWGEANLRKYIKMLAEAGGFGVKR